ncbi:Cleavage/polyadenylation specificity factor A subunit C-terminal [Penicillium angulare]|uniref:Protein CFT1 n=1 Tax=Penicillium angulare TaxID=116970 RepID=A0A9W9EUM8_9EURO|nr:Cleavage/polyadenylation specificity factor A subunit C-terminal [Penicillium angulare]
MQCYTELLPPMGVTHALALPFLSSTATNLVVVRSSLLQVFSLRKPPSENIGTHSSLSHLSEPKLILEKEYSLPGTVTDLNRVKILNSKSGGEAILLAVRNAKLSLIEWDPQRHSISTVSIHYYERDDLTRSPWVPDLSSCGSILSVDPSSRCAVFNFGVRNLAILPFHQAGDDLVMDDYDPDLDGDRPDQTQKIEEAQIVQNKDGTAHSTPYAASFVLPLTALDPSLLHPVSLEFLYEYREPTFGILYSQVATSNSLVHERKDIMFYTVFTLDLEQRASTTLLSVSRLPSDLFKIVALPPPVGGALLIGTNEIVHVDQAGKTNAVGVNEFSRQVSSFSMSDQSDLGFRLEGCIVERLGGDSGDLLIALASGDVALIKFKLDGRSVSGMSIHSVPAQAGGDIIKSPASCSTCFNDGNVFIGSEDGDSVLIGWTHSASSKKSRSEIKQISNGADDLSDDDQMDEDSYEDDLYSSLPERVQSDARRETEASTPEYYRLQLNDQLCSISPLRDVTIGQAYRASDATRQPGNEDVSTELELVASQGSGGAGGLVVINRELDPPTKSSFESSDADGVWSVSMVTGKKDTSHAVDSDIDAPRQYVITSRLVDADREVSEIMVVEGQDLKPIKAADFNPNDDITIDIGLLADETRLVQVLRNEVRIYDKDLELAQIYLIWDEETDEERHAVSASFADPFLAILRDDSSLLLLQMDASGDLDEVSLPEELSKLAWHSASLYLDTSQFFRLDQGSDTVQAQGNTLLFLLSPEYKLSLFDVPGMKLLSVIEGVDCLQPILSRDLPRKSNVRETLKEILVADLGDTSVTEPFLIIRTVNDDLAVYKPVFIQSDAEDGQPKLQFFREPHHTLANTNSLSSPENDDQILSRTRPLRALSNISGLSTVFMPGYSGRFLVRTAKSPPHVIRLRGEFTRWLSGFDSPALGCERGFIYVDSEHTIRSCQLPPNTQLDYPWILRKIPLHEQVDFLTYATASETYVVATSSLVGFKLPENDELHSEWRNEALSFLPEVPQSSIKVVSPQTWEVIDSYPLEAAEHVTAIKNVNLEVSENTHERKDLIVVGTSITKGEDIPARGCIYVFDVIEVVPEPGRPETGRRLKLVGKESVKGAVTALSGIGGQGFVIVAQGQKCMVRGLKEDGSLLPVAFMDLQSYVNVAKELKGTGMCILGDAVKGLWFAGYSEEPYKMSLFGKDPEYLEVVAADFLPDGNKLYILVADSDCTLHVLQYDPEDPKSSNGDRLLSRSKFYTGNFASTVTLLPRTAVSSELIEPSAEDEMDVDQTISTYNVLIASQNGSLALVTTVAEESYRRLSALQSQLINTTEHPGGLNPRAFRAVESDGASGRGMVDGTLLRQWLNLGKQRQVDIAGRVGATEWEIRADLEAIGGDGLGYL